MTTSMTLQKLKDEFDHWRHHKTSQQGRIPMHLRTKAVSLRQNHSDEEITQTLRINRKRFQSWADEPSHINKASAKLNPFVALPLPKTEGSSTPKKEQMTLTGNLANGLSWSLQGDFSTEQLTALVTALTGTEGIKS